MQIATIVLGLIALFFGFVMEHMPMPQLIDWFQPLWVLVTLTLLVYQAPKLFGLWVAVPIGLLLDAEQGVLMGTHVFTLAVHIFLVQLFFRRIEVFNVFQHMFVVLVLALLHQMLRFWLSRVLFDFPHPVDIWGPALSSAFVWPWLFALARVSLYRFGR